MYYNSLILIQRAFRDNKYKELEVLIVEDDSLNQIVLKSMLEKLGFKTVYLAGVPKKAIAFLENSNSKIALILMDIGLPIMTGIELTRKIRESSWNAKNVPIIAVTGNSDSIKGECLEAGMNEFMAKPVSYDLLKEVLKKNTKIS